MHPVNAPSAAPATTSQTADADASLTADLHRRGIDLASLTARIQAATRDEAQQPITNSRLHEIENLRSTIAELLEATTSARNRALAQAVAARWTYKEIKHATGLSTTRIGQITPVRKPRT